MDAIFNAPKGDICHIRFFECVGVSYIKDYEYEKAFHSRSF